MYFAGQVSIRSNSTIELKIHENLTTSGGIFNLISLKNQTIQLLSNFLQENKIHLILIPLLLLNYHILQNSFLPHLSLLLILQGHLLTLIYSQKKNRIGLIWSDAIFDNTSNTWFLTNFRVTEDFYRFSASHEASS